MILDRDQRFLLIGDSITDCGRGSDPEGLGHGYVRLIRDYLVASQPARAPVVLNRGISGHKVTDLHRRWEQDVIELSPDLLSIKIGINDVWHGLGGNGQGVSIDVFRDVYRGLLKRTREVLPETSLVLCEPSVIWPPAPEAGDAELESYVEAVRELATEFEAVLVPLREAFSEARLHRSVAELAPDGVHPSSTGHMLIARTWLRATGLL